MVQSVCEVYCLGRVAYDEAWALQERLAGEIGGGERPPALLLLEHPHTYTFGRRGQLDHLLWDAAELRRREAAVYWVDRGGDVTYHGPGQLVGYPLLPLAVEGLHPEQGASGPLRLPQADYVGYVRRLECVLIGALERLGLPAESIEGLTGVWVRPRGAGGTPAKIAAIGVKVDARGVTRHGFALNVAPDMAYWGGIVACGLKDADAAALADLVQPPPGMAEVIEAVIDSFRKIFGFAMRPANIS